LAALSWVSSAAATLELREERGIVEAGAGELVDDVGVKSEVMALFKRPNIQQTLSALAKNGGPDAGSAPKRRRQ
jgi:hypothetical protein